MSVSELVAATTRPIASLLQEIDIFGTLFSSKQLTFDMQEQTESNWCWAATATSISHFYWSWSTWNQCLVANGELGHNDCCNSSVPSACNVPWYLDRALTRTNNLVSMIGPASFQQVREEIDAGRPVGARVGWSGGGGHFMVIYGYSFVAGDEYFDIDDPIYGQSHLPVSDFASTYQGSGTWTHTYFTKAHFIMPIKLLIPIEPVLRRIWEIRPLLHLKQDMSFLNYGRAVAGGGPGAAEDGHAALGMAHRVYAVGLDALLAEQNPTPQPIAIRVYEVTNNTPRAFFDVSEAGEPRVLQMSASPKQLDPFTRALAHILTTLDRNDQEAELKLLRVPALNFEALWLTYEGATEDVVVPLRAVGRLTPHQPVSFRQALDALREAAGPLAHMDDTMGA